MSIMHQPYVANKTIGNNFDSPIIPFTRAKSDKDAVASGVDVIWNVSCKHMVDWGLSGKCQ